MKKILFLSVIMVSSVFVIAQTKSQKPAVVKKAVGVAAAEGSKPVLKSLADSASYALGYNIAGSIKKDVGDLNTNILMQAIKDAFENKPSVFDEATAYSIFTSYSTKVKEQEADKVIAAGNDFLAKNKLRAGVKTTTSGLQYEIIKGGSGEKPTVADTVICNYAGTLIDGTEFDNSYKRGEPLTIPVGAVIKGWTEGLQLMNKGSKYKFYIPYELAYGLRGAPPTIPGGAALIFEVELLDVKKAK